MKKILTIATICLFIVAAAWPSFAATGRGHKGMRNMACNPKASFAELNLTSEQLVKMDDLRTAHMKDVKPLGDKLFSLQGDLRLLWLEKSPDPAKIAAVQKDIRALRDQMEDKMTAHHLEILKILTPEQQIKFKAGMAHRGFGPDGMGPGGGHKAGMGPGPGPCMQK